MSDEKTIETIKDFLMDYTDPKPEVDGFMAGQLAEHLFNKLFKNELVTIKSINSWKDGSTTRVKAVSDYPVTERCARDLQARYLRKDPRGYGFYSFEIQHDGEAFISTWQCESSTGD